MSPAARQSDYRSLRARLKPNERFKRHSRLSLGHADNLIRTVLERLNSEFITPAQAETVVNHIAGKFNGGQRLPKTFYELRRSFPFLETPKIPVLIEPPRVRVFPRDRASYQKRMGLYYRTDKLIREKFARALSLEQRRTLSMNYKYWVQRFAGEKRRMPSPRIVIRFVSVFAEFLRTTPGPTPKRAEAFVREFERSLAA